jgi:hypothetical protein
MPTLDLLQTEAQILYGKMGMTRRYFVMPGTCTASGLKLNHHSQLAD